MAGCKANTRGWSRSGTIYTQQTKEERKVANMSTEDKIIADLKANPFVRGKTYRELAAKYNVSQHKVLTIRKTNKL